MVMIARNEAASIARCLHSVRDWVDAMVVLDTGSTDDTVAIARAAGAQVHLWAWRDDFAAARNAALALSPADWNLVLDADEWLVGDGAAIGQALRQAGDKRFIGLVPVHSQLDSAPAAAAGGDLASNPAGDATPAMEQLSWLPRLLPRGVVYTGRIHEQPVSDLPRQRLGVRIGHDGYRWHKAQQKKGRNRALLVAALRDEPENPYLHYQLGKDRDVYGDAAQALACYEQALQRMPAGHPCRIDAVVRTLVCLKLLGLHALGQQFAEDEMPACGQSPDFFYVLADLLVDFARLEPERGARELLPLARISLLFCLKIGDTPDVAGSVSGRGSHLAAHALALMDGPGARRRPDE